MLKEKGLNCCAKVQRPDPVEKAKLGKRASCHNQTENTMRKGWFFAVFLIVALSVYGLAQESVRTIKLPKPDTTGGKPLMQALKERKTSRSFSDKKLSQQVLSNLLWAAFGINRPDGHRTAPSARNWQEIDIYVATAAGLYLYEPRPHSLRRVLPDDLRATTGMQDFVGTAPVNLVYVADLDKVGGQPSDDRNLFVGADCGFIAQNVYLYCASQGLSTVVRGTVDREKLAKAMKLRPEQRILLAQTVGYPK
jgi:SagB-type dehydrogenase family enzyme